jgi:hypothetical protein
MGICLRPAGGPSPGPPRTDYVRRGENWIALRQAISRGARPYGAAPRGPHPPGAPPPGPLPRKLRGRGGDAIRQLGARTGLLLLQAVQSPQGDFVWSLRRSGEFIRSAALGPTHQPDHFAYMPPSTLPQGFLGEGGRVMRARVGAHRGQPLTPISLRSPSIERLFHTSLPNAEIGVSLCTTGVPASQIQSPATCSPRCCPFYLKSAASRSPASAC